MYEDPIDVPLAGAMFLLCLPWMLATGDWWRDPFYEYL